MGSWALSVVLTRAPGSRAPVGRWPRGLLGPGSGRCAVRGADAGEARRGEAAPQAIPRRPAGCCRSCRQRLGLGLTAAGVRVGTARGGGGRRLRRPGGGSGGPQAPAPARRRGVPPARGQRLGSRPGAEAPPLLPFPLVKRLELRARSGLPGPADTEEREAGQFWGKALPLQRLRVLGSFVRGSLPLLHPFLSSPPPLWSRLPLLYIFLLPFRFLLGAPLRLPPFSPFHCREPY